jgi:hypothetical protein
MYYVNQGLGSCILHTKNSNHVLRVTKGSLETETSMAINERLAQLDPKGQRFGYSKHLETLSLSSLSAQWPEVYEAYKQCEESADHSQRTFGANAGSPSKQVSVSEMLLLYPRPAKQLEKYQKTYLEDSLKILHSAGIIHDDIHENNIMSSEKPESGLWWPILVDWDQAKFTSSPTDFARDYEKLEETIQKINNDNARLRPPRPSRRSPIGSGRRDRRLSPRGLFGSSRKSAGSGQGRSAGSARSGRSGRSARSPGGPPSQKKQKITAPNFD